MTALSFELDPLAAAVVARLQEPTNLNVHVGHVTDSDAEAKTVSAQLPYVRINAGIGFKPSERAGGRAGSALRFTISYTGASEDQTRAVAHAVRAWMKATVTADGRDYRIRLDESEEVLITVDPTWNRPDGGPLYYGIDDYVVV